MITEVPYCQFCGQHAGVEKYRWKPCCNSCLYKAKMNDIATITILINDIKCDWSKYNNSPQSVIISPYYKFTIELIEKLGEKSFLKETE